MGSWLKQIVGVLLVLGCAWGATGLTLLIRSNQAGQASRPGSLDAVTLLPADGAKDVPVNGQIRVHYAARPALEPGLKLEPVVRGVLGAAAQWDGSTLIVPYQGLRPSTTYHAELDQDLPSTHGERGQQKRRWTFETGSPHTIPVTPAPTATGTPARQLIWWYNVPDGKLVAVDWQGKHVSTLSLGPALQSPDGSRLWSGDASAGQDGSVYDQDGHRLGTIQPDAHGVWADDSRHVCELINVTPSSAADPQPTTLVAILPDGDPEWVSQVGNGRDPNRVPSLRACSFASDRALVTLGTSQYVSGEEYFTVFGNTGLYQKQFPNPLAQVVANHDAQNLAEQFYGNAGGSPVTIIRQLPQGTAVGQLAGVEVQGFSWGGSLVVVTNGPNGLTEVINWRTHKVLWRSCTCDTRPVVRVLARPGGDDLAIAVSAPEGTATAGTRLTIVHPDGTSVQVGGGPIQPAF